MLKRKKSTQRQLKLRRFWAHIQLVLGLALLVLDLLNKVLDLFR